MVLDYLRPEEAEIPPPRDHWPEDSATPIKHLVPVEVPMDPPRAIENEAMINYDRIKPDLINERKPIG